MQVFQQVARLIRIS